jgi:cholesterol transport system auxiliary component
MFRRLALSAALIALTACTQPEVPKDSFYRLTSTPPAKVFVNPPLPGTLEVERLLADGVTGERAFVYSKAGASGSLFQYHYHYWTEPPGVMLQERMVNHLRAAKAAGSVVTPGLRVTPNHMLKGRIIRFEQVRGDSETKVAVEIEIAITREKDMKLLKVQTYSAEETATDASIPQAVNAFDRALARLLDQFLSDLGK